MCGRELPALVNDARSGLSDRHQIENNRLLSTTVFEKILFAHTLQILARQPRRFQHVREIVVEA